MMLLRPRRKTRVLLVRPGSTEFDEQGRIKGSLDIPLSKSGKAQADSVAIELFDADVDVQTIYTSPSRSALQTAKRLAAGRTARIKVIDSLRNIDHGLWHGKLIEEVKRNQPKLYKRGSESADDVCPPQGESITEARERVLKSLRKLLAKRSGGEVITLVIPDPLASLVESYLRGEKMCNLWNAERDAANWTVIDQATA